jgi:hypothetical protein
MNKPTLMLLSGFLLGMLVTLLLYQNDRDALQFIATPSPYPVRVAQQTARGSMPAQNADATQSRRTDASTAAAPAQPLSFTLGSGQTVQFSAEFVSLVKQLQASGVSEETLAGFVQAEFSRQVEIIAEEMQRKMMRGDIDQREQLRFSADMRSNQTEAVKALLGDEAYLHWEKQNALRWAEDMNLALTPEQAMVAYQASKKYTQSGPRDLFFALGAGEIDPTDFQEQQAALQKEYEQQMAALIGADGIAKLKRNNDWNYGTLRRGLKDLNLSDAQIDALYAVTQQYNQKQQELSRQNQSGKPQPQDYGQQITALNNEREQEMQRILGADGYAQYQKVTDSRYQQLKQYAPAWQLTPADIEHVYQSMTQAMQAADDYQRQALTAGQGQPVNLEDILTTADDYKRQAEDELRQYLGEDRFNKLKRAGVIQMKYHIAGSSRHFGP